MPRNGKQHALGGVNITNDSSSAEFVLSPGASSSKVANLADEDHNSNCTFDDIAPATLDGKAMIRKLQAETRIQQVFYKSTALSFYREMASGKCNPLSMGSTLQLESGLRLTARLLGPGVRFAVTGQPTSFSIDLDVHNSDSTATGPSIDNDLSQATSLAARLVGPSLVAAQVTLLEHGWHSAGSQTSQVRATFAYNVIDPGAYLLEVLLSSFHGTPLNHLLYRGKAEVVKPEQQMRNASAQRHQAHASLKLCVRGGAAPGRWVR
eukprot:6828108-Prymnesium_polylepis.1